MCNLVYLATDSDEDLSVRDNELIRFERQEETVSEPVAALLELPHRWFVGSRSGCSCTFRHWMAFNGPPCFGDPEDWCPEEDDKVEATRMLYRTIECLLSLGRRVELLNSWNGEDADRIRDLEVCLDQVPITAFRLFEGYRFRFRRRSGSQSVRARR